MSKYTQITTRFADLVSDFQSLSNGFDNERFAEISRLEKEFHSLASFMQQTNLKSDALYISNLSMLFQKYADAIWDSNKSEKLLSFLEKYPSCFLTSISIS
jgi:hypothetical protein